MQVGDHPQRLPSDPGPDSTLSLRASCCMTPFKMSDSLINVSGKVLYPRSQSGPMHLFPSSFQKRACAGLGNHFSYLPQKLMEFSPDLFSSALVHSFTQGIFEEHLPPTAAGDTFSPLPRASPCLLLIVSDSLRPH